MRYDPYTYRGSRRSVVMAPRGMVAASQPLAAQAGIDILKAGGNAIDAAIAVNAALGVVEPMSCGIGGDLFAIVWEAESGELTGLNASGRAPYAATIEHYAGLGYDYVPDTGPLNWSVPGCVDGWDCLLDRFGTMSMAKVLEPAIDYAENGFPVSDIIARDWAGSTSLLEPWPESSGSICPAAGLPNPVRYSVIRTWPDPTAFWPKAAETRSTTAKSPTPSWPVRATRADCSAPKISGTTCRPGTIRSA